MSEKHSILGGKVHVDKRPGSPVCQCSTYLLGKNRRVSTKEKSLQKAKDFAEDWYLELRGKSASSAITGEKTFKQAADRFVAEYEVMTTGERNERYASDHQARLRNHLILYFGKLGLSEVTAGKAQEYRMFRMSGNNNGKAPARSTLHQEIMTFR